MTKARIRWHFGGDQGYWTSHERRFRITPQYFGTTTPQDYVVRDCIGPGFAGRTDTLDTVQAAKEMAEHWLQKERQAEADAEGILR